MEDYMGIPYVDADGNIQLKYKTAKWYYHNDENYRAKVKEQMRQNYLKKKAENPEYDCERQRAYQKKKYDENPEYRAKKNEAAKRRYHEKKAQRLAAQAQSS